VKFKQNGAFNLDSKNMNPSEVALVPIDPHPFRGHTIVVNKNKATEVCYSFALGFSESLLPYVEIPKSKLSKINRKIDGYDVKFYAILPNNHSPAKELLSKIVPSSDSRHSFILSTYLPG